MFYQQGDLILTAVGGVEGKATDNRVLAEGEATGHSHVIDDAAKVFVAEDGTLYVETDAPVSVLHEEHGTITIPAGKYRVGRVMEYDHFAEEASQVID